MALTFPAPKILQLLLDKPLILSPNYSGEYELQIKVHTDSVFTTVVTGLAANTWVNLGDHTEDFTLNLGTLYDIKFVDSSNDNETNISYVWTDNCYIPDVTPSYTSDPGRFVTFNSPEEILPSGITLHLFVQELPGLQEQISSPITENSFTTDYKGIELNYDTTYRFYWVYIRDNIYEDVDPDTTEAVPIVDWHTCIAPEYVDITILNEDCPTPVKPDIPFEFITRRQVRIEVPEFFNDISYYTLQKKVLDNGTVLQDWAVEVANVPNGTTYVYVSNLSFGKEYQFKWIGVCE